MNELLELQSHEFQLGKNRVGFGARQGEQDLVVDLISVAISSGGRGSATITVSSGGDGCTSGERGLCHNGSLRSEYAVRFCKEPLAYRARRKDASRDISSILSFAEVSSTLGSG